MKRVLVIAVALTFVIVAAPALADAGPDAAAIYKSKCAMCHGPDGAGQTPTGKTMKVRDLRSADVQKMTDKALATIIADGKGKMPAYKGKLGQAEIEAIVKFIRDLKK